MAPPRVRTARTPDRIWPSMAPPPRSVMAPPSSAASGNMLRLATRRLPDDRRQWRSSLCRQGKKRPQTDRQLYAAFRPYHAHRKDDRADRVDGLRFDRDRDRSLAARDEFHQADEAAFQCLDARRQVVSLYLAHRRPCRAADHQASRRAQPEGRVFRPFASVRRGQSHLERPCSAPFFCAPARTAFTPIARGRACSTRSSAARLPAPGKSAKPNMPNSWPRPARFLSGKSRASARRPCARNGRGLAAMEFERAARLRDRIAALSAIQGAQGINPKTGRGRGCFAIVEQAGQFCVEVFFSGPYQNWGNRAYFRAPTRASRRTRSSIPFWPSFTRTSRRRASFCFPMKSRIAAC